ncbi:MAG: lamin tail domain-containing protein [Parcubacteria group bacterium]|nr:lamin tail domain-containing protein [Parcubacteria group bacterium]
MLVVIALLSLVFMLPAPAAASQPTVGLSQIKTQGEKADDEFIELFNPGESGTDLSGFKLVKETAGGGQYTLVTFGQVFVAARSYYLVAHKNGVFGANADATYSTALADNNRLYLLAPDAAVVDTVSWGTISGATLANPGKDDSIARSWQEATMTWTNFSLAPFLREHKSGETFMPTEPLASAVLAINEAALWPVGSDMAWVELQNSTDAPLDLTGWTVQNGEQVLAALAGVLAPAGYTVAFWPPTSPPASLALHYHGQAVDTWVLSPAQAANTTLALDTQQQRTLTGTPTAGRPNVITELVVAEPVACVAAPVPPPTAMPIVSAPTSAPIATPLLSATNGRVRLNEIFANPSGDESAQEFIELYNEESFAVDITDWHIADAVKSTILANKIIPALGYLVLKKADTGLSLNNSDEIIRLSDKNNAPVSELTYETTTEDTSLNWASLVWYEAAPTPGLANAALALPASPAAPASPAPATDPTTTPITAPAPSPTPIEPPAPKPVPTPKPISSPDPIPAPSAPSAPDTNVSSLRLNELLPNPVGSDDEEWIELHNAGKTAVRLAGVSLADPAKTYALPDATLAADGYVLITRSESGIALNNDGDELRLLAGSTLLDELVYEDSVEGQSWARDASGEWVLMETLTPGKANSYASVNVSAEASPKAATAAAAKTRAKTATEIDFVSWDNAKDRELVALRAVLIAAPGTFNAKTAYVQGEDGDGPGVELYFSKADWPNLDVGDVLRVVGKKSAIKDGRRLLVSSGEDIDVLDHVDVVAAAASASDLAAPQANTLVLLSGELSARGKKDLAVSAAQGDGTDAAVKIALSKASLAAPEVLPQSMGEVVGLYRPGKTPEVWPRSEEDLIIAPVQADAAQTQALSLTATGNTQPSAAPSLSTILAAAAAILLGLGYFFKDHLKKYIPQAVALIRNRLAL